MPQVKAPEPAAVRAPLPTAARPPRQGWFLQHSEPDPNWSSPDGRVRRLLGPVVVGAGAAAAATLLHMVDPRHPGHYPTCPFLALTGYYCPGCGALRAMASLTDGDVVAALGYNPLAVAAVAGLLVVFGFWVARQWAGRPKLTITRPWVTTALALLVIAFWIARNIPGWTWLSPA